MQRLDLGPLPVNGWSFADGAVSVIRSQGHCAGHVIVYLRDSRLLHLGDEDNGPFGSMPDADQVKVQSAFGLAASLIDSGSVQTITDGHGSVHRDAEARASLDDLLDQAVSLQSLSLPARSGTEPVDGHAFLDRLTDDLKKRSDDRGQRARRSGLDAAAERNHQGSSGTENPAPVTGKPQGLGIIPAAAEMLR